MATRATAQTVAFIAWDTANNAGKTGDANFTMRWIKDGTSAALATATVTEIDSTNAPGLYKVSVSNTETDCNIGYIAGKSSTSGISLIPVKIEFERLPDAAAGASGGVPTVDSNNAVKLQTGTGSNQILLSNGQVSVATNSDKTGYSLTQTFPANFSTLSIDGSGRMDIGKILGTASAGAAGFVGIDWGQVHNQTSTITLSNTAFNQILGNVGGIAGVAFPANFSNLAITSGGLVSVGSNADKTGYSRTQSFPANFSSLAIAATTGLVSVGTNNDKTGYSLTQTFPAHFADLAVTSGTGQVTVGTNNDKTGYSLTQTFPANFSSLAIASGTGLVSVGTNADKSGYSLTQTFPAHFADLAIAATTGLVSVGSNADKTGYSLAQSFPANFASLAITSGGLVSVGTNADKTGYGLTQTFPANFSSLAIASGTGRVTVGTNADKTGYSLIQTFPTNFAVLAITDAGLVNSGGATIVLPVVSTVASGEVRCKTIVAYQHAAFGPFVFFIKDATGNPVNLSGHTVTFVASNDGVFLFQVSGTVGGTDSNQVTVSQDDTNTATSGAFQFVLRDMTADSVIARGELLIEAAVDAH